MELHEHEQSCLEACVKKMYLSERLLKSYIPRKFNQLPFKEIEHRLDNPTDPHGPYFEH